MNQEPSRPPFLPRDDTFSGQVMSASRESPIPEVRVTSVLFTPGSRTFWHRHEGGQVLVVTGGRGVVGSRDGGVITVSSGDVVVSSPGDEHFHGAVDEWPLIVEAISFGTTTWLEEMRTTQGSP